MTRPETTGFQKRLDPSGWKGVGLAVITYEGHGAMCSCGWSLVHHREKVRENAVDRHLRKRHAGRGIRL